MDNIYFLAINKYNNNILRLFPSLWGTLTFNSTSFIIHFREKCFKRNIKNTFRENVFVCEDFSLNRKENKLHRKYRFFSWSTENAKAPPILEIEQNILFHWI